MVHVAALLAVVVLLPAPGLAQQSRGLNLQAAPPASPFFISPPPPPSVVRLPTERTYEAAPTPNRDVDAPLAPRAGTDPELAPSLFTRGRQYRGEGFSEGSSAQSAQERKAQPGAGFKLRLPLQGQ